MTTSQITDPVSFFNKVYTEMPQLNRKITVNNVIDFLETAFEDQVEEIVDELIKAFTQSKGGRPPRPHTPGYEHVLWCLFENQKRSRLHKSRRTRWGESRRQVSRG